MFVLDGSVGGLVEGRMFDWLWVGTCVCVYSYVLFMHSAVINRALILIVHKRVFFIHFYNNTRACVFFLSCHHTNPIHS